MPDHLKISNKPEKPSSMPPKMRISEEDEDSPDRLNQTVNYDKLAPKPLKIDNEVEQEIKAKQRTGSTGGSSMKDAEILRVQNKKTSGSPSPSPIGHPKFPMIKAPILKHVLAAGKPAQTISNSSSRKTQRALNQERSNINKRITKLSKGAVDFSNLFKNMHKNKKHKNKGISQSDLSSGTPIGIGNVAPPFISKPAPGGRGKHKKAATAFAYENLNNSFQIDRFRHYTITTTPSQKNKRKRKGSKKVGVNLNHSLVLNPRSTTLSKNKMSHLMNSTLNPPYACNARPVSVLNKTVYTTGLREQMGGFPNLMLTKKKKKGKFRVRSRGKSPKNTNSINNNLYQAYMRGHKGI